jgi:hypothetical protein
MSPFRMFVLIGVFCLACPYAVAQNPERVPSVRSEAEDVSGSAKEDVAAVKKCVGQIASLFSSARRISLEDVSSLCDDRVSAFGVVTGGERSVCSAIAEGAGSTG